MKKTLISLTNSVGAGRLELCIFAAQFAGSRQPLLSRKRGFCEDGLQFTVYPPEAVFPSWVGDLGISAARERGFEFVAVARFEQFSQAHCLVNPYFALSVSRCVVATLTRCSAGTSSWT